MLFERLHEYGLLFVIASVGPSSPLHDFYTNFLFRQLSESEEGRDQNKHCDGCFYCLEGNSEAVREREDSDTDTRILRGPRDNLKSVLLLAIYTDLHDFKKNLGGR